MIVVNSLAMMLGATLHVGLSQHKCAYTVISDLDFDLCVLYN